MAHTDNYRVLIVEADEFVRRIVGEMVFRITGSRPQIASTLKEGLNHLKTDPEIKIAFIDIHPQSTHCPLDDLLGARQELSVAFTSTDLAENLLERGLITESVLFLKKPFGISELEPFLSVARKLCA